MSYSGPPESEEQASTADSIAAPPPPLNNQPKPDHPLPNPWSLDPDRLPRAVAVELPEGLWRALLERARQSGRDFSEIALELIDQQLSQVSTADLPQGDEGRAEESTWWATPD